MLSFSAAVSPELRALMEKATTTADDMKNANLTPAKQVWSRQLYYICSARARAERRRGDCRTCQRVKVLRRGGRFQNTTFSEHYEPKTATGYVGMLRQILLYDFGSSLSSSIGSNSSGQEARGAER